MLQNHAYKMHCEEDQEEGPPLQEDAKIASADEAAYDQEEGVLIRLVEKNGRIIADLFDEEDLTIVAREGIEVR